MLHDFKEFILNSGNVERVGELESESRAAANGNFRRCASSSGMIRIKSKQAFTIHNKAPFVSSKMISIHLT